MKRVLPSVREILTSLVILTLTLNIMAPAAYAQSGSVSGEVSLQNSNVDCNGNVQGNIVVDNNGGGAITVTGIGLSLTDTALNSTFYNGNLDTSSTVIPANSSANFGFNLLMTGGTTKYDPEPATVSAGVEYYYSANKTGASPVYLSTDFTITHCPLHNGGSLQQPGNSTGSSSPLDIPEFPLQLVTLTIFTAVIIATYLLVRRRTNLEDQVSQEASATTDSGSPAAEEP